MRFFAVAFESAPIPEPGATSIRQWDTFSTIFGPMYFLALRTEEGVELIDYASDDPNYWQLVNDDPDD
jgi:hypothetical protein